MKSCKIINNATTTIRTKNNSNLIINDLKLRKFYLTFKIAPTIFL